MKQKTALLFLFLCFCNFSSYSQLKKMFVKTPNRRVETDINGNQLSAIQSENTKYAFYYDALNGYGKLIATERNGMQWKINLKEMYTGYAKGLKVYYFKSANGMQKISTTAEENGLSIYNYGNKILTIFYSE